jgi:hypothetical protein
MKEVDMLADLEALAPPLIVAAAFLVAVVMFLRHQMAPPRGGDEGAAADDIPGEFTQSRSSEGPEQATDTRDRQFTPNSDDGNRR